LTTCLPTCLPACLARSAVESVDQLKAVLAHGSDK